MQDKPVADGSEARIYGSEVEMTTRALLELAAERLGLDTGLARLEAELDDGRLATLWTRRKHRVTELDNAREG